MKKLTSILIVLLLIVSVFTLVACDQSDELKFAELEDGTYEVVGINTKGAKELTIPSEYNGKPVTAIGSGALRGCEKLKEITLPSTLKYIDSWAFKGCEDLESVVIPEGVTEIGRGAFSGCTSLESVTIPESVTIIGDSAFYGCTSLRSIALPSGITAIGNSAFYLCSALTEITIPTGVESIGNRAFEDCTSLSTVVIPETVNSIGAYAFDNTAIINNESNKEGGVIYIGKNLIKADSALSGTYTVKDGTLTIAGTAFLGCTELTGIVLDDETISIGNGAFKNCEKLVSVTFGSTLEVLGESAFENCKAITELAIPTGIKNIYNFTFKYCTNLATITLPEGIERIGNEAFYFCSALTGITLPESTTSIGNHAFSLCKTITEFVVPENVVYIGNNVFEGSIAQGEYNALEKVSFEGDKLEKIGNAAFRYCYNLSEIALPNSVKEIGKNAFQSCTSLTMVTIPENTSFISDQIFKDCTSLIVIHFGENVTKIGTEAFSGCKALTSIRLENNIVSVGEKAFQGCNSVKIYCTMDSAPSGWHKNWNPISGNVTWNSAPVQETSDGLQYMITSEANKTVVIVGYTGEASSLTIPATIVGGDNESYTVVGIEDGAFANCYTIDTFDIDPSIKVIGSGVFFNTGYYNDKNNENWEDGALYVGHILATVREDFNGSCVVKHGTTAIANKAFESCRSLTSVVIPKDVVVGANIFLNCKNLVVYCEETSAPSTWNTSWNDIKAKVIWGILDSGVEKNDFGWIKDSEGNITIIGYTGEDTAIEIPATIGGATVTTIGTNAFNGCVNITSFVIPDSVLFIRENAFTNTGYYNLESNWEGNVLYIGKHLIKARSSIMTIKFKDGTLVIADNALYGCGIKTLTFVDSIVAIGDYAFYGCERIQSVVLPSALQHIGSYAFANCQRLKTIKIPAGVITVGEKMLSGCTSLTKIYCGATAKPEGWDNNWNPDKKVNPTWGSN